MGNAQTNRPDITVLTREQSRRVDRYIVRVGMTEARARLHVGESTLAAARDDGGRMMARTWARLSAALDEVGA